MISKNPKSVEKLVELHKERKALIQRRLGEFSQVTPDRYFYELLYCMMTPQSSAEHAERTVGALQEVRFESSDVDPEPILRRKEHYIRFHITKAKHLMKAKEQFESVVKAVSNGSSAFELREWLVSNVLGLGYKEATHFLRNIGKNGGLAILDRHILRNLKRFGVLRSIPQSLSRTKYFVIEKKFAAFAHRIGIPLDELDLLFWSMETGEIRK